MNKNPAIAQLKSRAVLRVSGKDSVSFLQNLISQDMKEVVAGKPIFSALLTPQGKYLYDFFVIPEENVFLLDVEAERAKDLITTLTRFRIRGDVTFENLSDTHHVFAMWDGEGIGYADPRHPALGTRLILPDGRMPQPNADESEYKELRYSLGIAEGSHEITAGSATLLEINFDALHGVSFDKGCYMGQELTARTHYRALIKRRYMPFKFEGAAPAKGTRLLHNGFELGEIHAVGSEHGIGLFHLEHTKPHLGTPVAQDGVAYTVFVPDYLEEFIR
jgi:folate-binding protein YgfZ